MLLAGPMHFVPEPYLLSGKAGDLFSKKKTLSVSFDPFIISSKGPITTIHLQPIMNITLSYDQDNNYALQSLDFSSQPTDDCGVSRDTTPAFMVMNCCYVLVFVK